MKKALVRKDLQRLFEVAAASFDVCPPMEWVDCADDVSVTTHNYDGTNFVLKPQPPVKTADELAAEEVERIRRLQFEIAFDMENRMRVREGKATITRVQYRNALINLWKAL